MAETKTYTASGGIGFGGLLTILFIALKLLHAITWPWRLCPPIPRKDRIIGQDREFLGKLISIKGERRSSV